MCCPSDQDYETHREQMDALTMAQANDAAFYGAMHEAMNAVSADMNVAFDLAMFAHERARRIRETEGL